MLDFDRTGRGAGAETSATAAVYRRVAARLLPFLLLCYIVAMIDRLNVGYAKLQFMADLNFDEAVFGMAAGSLYVGYILFEVPSNLMLERIGLKLTLLRIMTLWGVFVMAMAFATSQWGFYAIRFMIGAGEAGFFPGVLFYLTLWFPNSWRARIVSMFAIGVPVSGVIAGPMSSWIMTHMAGLGGLHGWQWLFLIEGAPAIGLGLVAYFTLPDRPAPLSLGQRKDDDRARSRKRSRGRRRRRLLRDGAQEPKNLYSRTRLFRLLFDPEHPPLVGSDPPAQRRRPRSRRDRVADVADLRRGRCRDGGDRVELRPQ